MATTKAGVVKLSGLTITALGEDSVKFKGSSGVRLSMTTVENTDTTKYVAKKKATHILEDYKQLFTGDRKSVSLFGSAAIEFDATAYKKYSAVKVINATAMASDIATSLKGNSNANQIIAGPGGATLDGGAGNDTLTGGKGEDVFIYSAGKDLIKSFTASSDSVSIDGEDVTVTDASTSGKNVVLKIDSKNTLTIEGMASKSLIFTDSDSEKTLTSGILYNEEDKSAKITSAFTKTAKTTINSDFTDIDASAAKKGVNLVAGSGEGVTMVGSAKNDTLAGGDGADSISGGKGNDNLSGGDGNDTLWGGVGNDTLTGGDGANEFIYAKGDGKDVIIGFTSEDTLTLDGISFTSATVNSKGTQVALKLGSGSITFKNFDSDTTFAIGDDTYQVVQSGKKYTFEQVGE